MAVAAVAQLDRVLGYEPRGRGFNSCQPHHPIEGLVEKLGPFHIHHAFINIPYSWDKLVSSFGPKLTLFSVSVLQKLKRTPF